jgi:hypothetical protein
MRVQAFASELSVEGFDDTVVRWHGAKLETGMISSRGRARRRKTKGELGASTLLLRRHLRRALLGSRSPHRADDGQRENGEHSNGDEHGAYSTQGLQN